MDSKVGRFSLEHLQDGLKRHLVKTLDLSGECKKTGVARVPRRLSECLAGCLGQRVEDDEFVTLMEMLKRDSVVQCIDCSSKALPVCRGDRLHAMTLTCRNNLLSLQV